MNILGNIFNHETKNNSFTFNTACNNNNEFQKTDSFFWTRHIRHKFKSITKHTINQMLTCYV